jgi:hypothetical protein
MWIQEIDDSVTVLECFNYYQRPSGYQRNGMTRDWLCLIAATGF